MSKVDEELTRRLHTAERHVDVDGVFEGLERRRAHRQVLRRAQLTFLALAVIAGSIGGFVALSRAFRERPRRPAAPLPTNGQIVFSDRASDGHEHLFGIDAFGSGLRRITDFETDDTNPAVSPDGRTVVFLHELQDLRPVVATMPIEGGPVTWLTEPGLFVTDGPAWSPDGTEITFAAHDGHLQRIYVMGSNGSDPRPITGDDTPWAEDPAWSPDGSEVAFSASPDAGDEGPTTFDIFTVGRNGDGLKNVTETPEVGSDEFGPSWSPDGTRLAYSRDRGEGMALVVRRLTDGRETTITDGSWIDVAPAWSPDGRLLAFERAPLSGGRSDIWRTDVDGNHVVQLTTDGGFNPAWQPLPEGAAEPTTIPEPTTEPEGADIGLGFSLCHLTRLDGVDFIGDGTGGVAWVGMSAYENGSCPPQGGSSRAVVAADFNGDELADSSWGGIEYCLYCEPYDATDLDADGGEELVVIESHSSTPAYVVLTVRPDSAGDPQLRPVVVAAPGHDAARLPGGDPLRISTGGDEGFSGWVRCEGFPDAPVLVLTWRDHPIEGDTMEVHETRLVIQDDGAAHIIDTNDYTAPVQSEIPGVSDAPACGVDWQIWV